MFFNRKPRRTKRPIFYICNAIQNNILISQKIEAQSLDEALGIFEKEFKIKAQNFHGPFAYRRDRSLGSREIVFGTRSINAIFNDWKVKAILLKNPPDCAFLLFQERVDGKKVARPKGTFIIKCEDLKYETNK